MYRQGVRGPGGRRIPADYQVTAFEPGTRLAFEAIAGPVRPTGEFRMHEADGTTTLTFSLQVELAGLKRRAPPGVLTRDGRRGRRKARQAPFASLVPSITRARTPASARNRSAWSGRPARS